MTTPINTTESNLKLQLEPTGLLGLPTEVLEQILHEPELPIESLYHISLLCRRLHHLSLPVFLARHGIDDPNGDVDLRFRNPETGQEFADALSGLRVALFVTAIKRLSFTFSHPGVVTYPAIKVFHRLETFIRRLESINELSVGLKTAIYNDSQAYTFSQITTADVDDRLSAFSSSFGRLLNTLIEKSCTSVTLGGGYGLSMTYRFWCRIPKNARPIAALKDLIDRQLLIVAPTHSAIQGNGWKYGPPKRQYLKAVRSKLSPTALSHSTLTMLTLSKCPNLLTPPFSICVLSILQLTSIISLKIYDISAAEEMWSIILPHISRAAPDLTELTISGCVVIHSSDMSKFLAGFNSLKRLTLGKGIHIEDEELVLPWQPYPSRLQFGNIETLRVSHDWLFKLLFVPHKIPRLNQLTIYPRPGHNGLHVTYDVMFVLLRSIIRRLMEEQWYPEINFTVPIGVQFCHLMLSFHEIANLQSNDLGSSDDELQLVPARDRLGLHPWVAYFPASKNILRAVDSLAIQIDNAEGIDISELSRWLALFPCLERLVVKSGLDNSSGLASRVSEALVLSSLPNLSTCKTEKRDTQPETILIEYTIPKAGNK